MRPRLRLPRPRPRPPQPRAAQAGGRGRVCPPAGSLSPGRKVRGCAGLRAGAAAAGEPALGPPVVAGGGREEDRREGREWRVGKKGECKYCDCWVRKLSVELSGISHSLLSEDCREARRPLQDNLRGSTRPASLISSRSCDGWESCPLRTFYSSFPKDRMFKPTSWGASAPGRLPLLHAAARGDPVSASARPFCCSLAFFVGSLLT